jgi:tRNA U55 pseudouridine synthase TruB
VVRITSIDILSIHFPYITLRAKVSSGTYIRSLALDIGRSLGGTALVTKLRRVGYHNFSLAENKINNHISLESHAFHPNEDTKLAQIEYSFLLPEFDYRDITPTEYSELQK